MEQKFLSLEIVNKKQNNIKNRQSGYLVSALSISIYVCINIYF
ncbi:MAG: hypothetical protein K0R15_913 [Clostridiales bacterium]|jgi:hypothetical protein|nr:hypothetical protein [Clostridiales bacterium]